MRANYRHHQAHIYVVTPQPVREDKYSAASVRVAGASAADYLAALEGLRDKLKAEPELVILFDDSFKGADVGKLVAFAESLGIPVRFVCLVDYANSRGAVDMGVTPELLPGYKPSDTPGMHVADMIEAGLDVLWVVGANPLRGGAPRKTGFLVVHDLFLTETAAQADIVLPAASAYEKNGTVTNVTGEVQRLTRAINTMGAKPDLEIMGFIAREMGRGCGARSLGFRNRLRRDPRQRSRVRGPRSGAGHRRRRADYAGEWAHPCRFPARPGPLRPQRPVRVRYPRALF